MFDEATLQMLMAAAKKKPTQTQAIGQGVSAGIRQASQIGQPGQFMKRGPDGQLAPAGQGGGAAPNGAAQQKAGVDRGKMLGKLLKKIFKSDPTEFGVPVDIRPDGQQMVSNDMPQGGPFGFGGYY